MIRDKLARYIRFFSESEEVALARPSDTLLVTNPSDRQTYAQNETLLQGIKPDATMALTFWDKHVDTTNRSDTFNAQARDLFLHNYAKRRANTTVAVADPSDLTPAWKTLVILPSPQHIGTIRESLPWVGVDADGVVHEGLYVPAARVMPASKAFSHIQTLFASHNKGQDPQGEGLFVDPALFNLNPHFLASRWKAEGKAWFFKTMEDDFDRFIMDIPKLQRFDQTRGLSQATLALRSVGLPSELRRSWTAHKAIYAAMDPDSLKQARGSGMQHAGGYNWLRGYVHEDRTTYPRLAQPRSQALTAFPLLGYAIDDSVSWNAEHRTLGQSKPYTDDEPPPDPLKQTVLEAIDTGAPLIPALAKTWHTSPAKVRALRGVTWQRTTTIESGRNLPGLARLLPLDTQPQTQQDYRAMKKVLSFCHDFGTLQDAKTLDLYYQETNQERLTPSIYTLESSGRAIWEDVQHRYHPLSKALGDYTPGGVIDMSNALFTDLLIPIAQSVHLAKPAYAGLEPDTAVEKVLNEQYDYNTEAYDLLYAINKDWTPRQLAEANTLWHRNLIAIDDQVKDPSIPTLNRAQWVGILGEHRLDKTLIARELTSARALTAQGKHHNHCVGGYTPSILTNGTHNKGAIFIFSLESEKHGERVIEATVQINRAYNAKSALVVQNYGRNNTSVRPSVRAAGEHLAKIVAKVPQSALNKHFASINEAKTCEETYISVSHNGKPSRVHQEWLKAGYDPRNTQRLEMAFQAYRPVLPKAWNKSLDTMRAHITALHQGPKRHYDKEEGFFF